MIRLNLIVALILLSSCFSIGFAQQQEGSCEQTLNLAVDEFNAGRFYGIPSMLKSCLDDGFSREQRQRAYHLLAQVYLLMDDPIGAENSYLEILWANPEFEADTARDPIDLVYLGKKFTADPIFSIFGKIGGNTSPVRVIHSIIPSGEPGVYTNYTLKPGYQFGAGFDWNISRALAVTTELEFGYTAYRKNQIQFNLDESEFAGKQNWLTIPVSVRYADTKGRLRPYGYVGFAVQLLVSDKGQIQLFKRDDIAGERRTFERESPSLDFLPYRNRLNRSMFLGGGARYKIGLDYVFADLRYSLGFSNLVVNTSTFDSDGPMVEWGHADDYFRLDNLAISVGYVKPLYKPRKLKKANTKKVLKGINKNAQ